MLVYDSLQIRLITKHPSNHTKAGASLVIPDKSCAQVKTSKMLVGINRNTPVVVYIFKLDQFPCSIIVLGVGISLSPS